MKVIRDTNNTNNILNDDTRNSMICEIVDCFLTKGILLQNIEIESIAKEICSVFSTEKIV